jgi:uncharacterized protein (UPF0276 family)
MPSVTSMLGTSVRCAELCEQPEARTWLGIGLAYSPSARRIADAQPSLVDFLEVPFELLESQPSLLERDPPSHRILLHSASLSLAGALPTPELKLRSLGTWAKRLSVPWISEHVAYVAAPRLGGSELPPYETGFTVPPPMNADVAMHVAARADAAGLELGSRILLENSPLYFLPPGSNMDQGRFFRLIFEHSSAEMLLDLTHLVISAHNLGLSAEVALRALPLERVTQLHVSGVEFAEGVSWDNHASSVPDEVLDLLPLALSGGWVQAITLEYNWISAFPDEAVMVQLERVRRGAAHATG